MHTMGKAVFTPRIALNALYKASVLRELAELPQLIGSVTEEAGTRLLCLKFWRPAQFFKTYPFSGACQAMPMHGVY